MKLQSLVARPGLMVLIGAGVFGGPILLKGAEIQLRSTCRTTGGLVLLEDIAEVLSPDAEEVKRLGRVDIAAAPPAGERRYLRAREIQDILASRGVNLAKHRISGASQVTVVGTLQTPKPAAAKPVAAPPKAHAPSVSPKQTADEFQKLLMAYLNECSARDTAEWQIQFHLDAGQTALLSAAGKDLIISGGHEPWTGKQQFQLAANLDGETHRITLHAEIALPATLVVAARPLAIGSIVREGDVRLQPGVTAHRHSHAYQTIEEVIGKEVARNVTENQILDEDSVRRPIYVRRGEIVTVYARAGGVQVRTTARARDEGSHNDLVAVESLNDRKPFSARVIGPQEVEVFAHAVSVPGEEGESRSLVKATQMAAAPPAPLPASKRMTTTPMPAEIAASSRVVARDVKTKNGPRGMQAEQTRTAGRVMAVVVPARRDDGTRQNNSNQGNSGR